MSEELKGLLLAAILFFGAGGFLFKLYVFDKLKNKQLFENLNKIGFSIITQTEIIEKLKKYKLSADGRRSSDTIQKAIGLQKGFNHNRYLCDVYRKKRSNHSTTHQYYTMIVDTLPFKIEGEIRIRTKLADEAEKFLKMRMSLSSGLGQEITEGLNRDFMSNFSAIVKSERNFIFPKKIQRILISHIDLFPFNQKRGPITTCLQITPEGWGIICNRVTNKDDLDQLLQVADKLTSVLSHPN